MGLRSSRACHSLSRASRGVGPSSPRRACPRRQPRSTLPDVSSRSCRGILALSNTSSSRLTSMLRRDQGGLRRPPPPPPASSSSSEASSCTRACTWTASQQRARRDSPSSSAWRCSWCRALCARPPRVPSSLKCFEEAFSTWEGGGEISRQRNMRLWWNRHLLTIRTQALQISPRLVSSSLKHSWQASSYFPLSVNRELKRIIWLLWWWWWWCWWWWWWWRRDYLQMLSRKEHNLFVACMRSRPHTEWTPTRICL